MAGRRSRDRSTAGAGNPAICARRRGSRSIGRGPSRRRRGSSREPPVKSGPALGDVAPRLLAGVIVPTRVAEVPAVARVVRDQLAGGAELTAAARAGELAHAVAIHQRAELGLLALVLELGEEIAATQGPPP